LLMWVRCHHLCKFLIISWRNINFDLWSSLLFDYANVIAIITLDIPVSFSKNLAPICLPPASTDSNQYVDQNAIVLGWTSKFKTRRFIYTIDDATTCIFCIV
jgi:hypothetical protein